MGASKYTGGRVCAELTAPDSSKTAHTPAAAKRNHRSGLSKVGSAKEARFAFRLVIVVIFTPIGFSRSGLLRICSLRLHLEALDHRLGGRISQNFHFGTQVARSIHLIASFAAIQSKFISHPVEFSTYRMPQNRDSAPAGAPEPGNSCRPTAGKETPSRPPSFLRQDFDLPAAKLYPAGTGSASIRRTMPPNSRRVRWLSASSNQ